MGGFRSYGLRVEGFGFEGLGSDWSTFLELCQDYLILQCIVGDAFFWGATIYVTIYKLPCTHDLVQIPYIPFNKLCTRSPI